MSHEGSSRWTEAAVLLGASLIASCGARSDLKDAQTEPNSCEDTAAVEVLCCEESRTPNWQGITSITKTEQTPEQLCKAVAEGTEAVICFLDQPWGKFVYAWAKTELDKNGDTVYFSNSYKTEGLTGEIECSYSSYEDENGVERENASCSYWDYDAKSQVDVWKWGPREYPGYTEVGMDFTAPGEPYQGFVVSAFYTDKNPTPDSGDKPDTPYVWISGVENPNDLKDAECGLDYQKAIARYSATISQIAQRVVFQQQ